MFSLLRTNLWFSTVFHLEIDGQSEVTIRVLEKFLRPYIEHRPSTCIAQLPLIEFAVNNAVNISTRFTPFYFNSWQHLVIPTMLLTREEPKNSNEAVKEVLKRMKTALARTQTNSKRPKRKLNW